MNVRQIVWSESAGWDEPPDRVRFYPQLISGVLVVATSPIEGTDSSMFARGLITLLPASLRAGMNDCLTKPFEQDDAIRVLARWVAD